MGTQHEGLRKRVEQHKPKNEKSKEDDKDVYQAMNKVVEYLKNKKDFQSFFITDYELDFQHEIEVDYMINFIRSKNTRKEFNLEFKDRSIVPDGGILYLKDKKENKKFPLVIAEIKRQGTNKERLAEGKASHWKCD